MWCTLSGIAKGMTIVMKITQLRNATIKLEYNGIVFLIDPMLSKKGTYPPVDNDHGNTERNPIVELPMPVGDIIEGIDAVIVTHDHIDHWDGAAEELIPKDMVIFVQGEPDASLIKKVGFTNVRVLENNILFKDVSLTPTVGQHYENEAVKDVLEKEFNTSRTMGVVFEATKEKKLFFTGDTIWFDGLKKELDNHQPEVIVMNAGGNGFSQGRLILDDKDVLKIHEEMPHAILIASHLEGVNHWTVSREDLRKLRKDHNLDNILMIPDDGETITL